MNFAFAPRDPGLMCDQVRAGVDVKADTPAVNHAGLPSAGNVSSISLNGYRKTARECRFLASAPGPAKRRPRLRTSLHSLSSGGWNLNPIYRVKKGARRSRPAVADGLRAAVTLQAPAAAAVI